MAIVEYMEVKYPKVKFTYTMGDVRLTPKQAVKAKKMGYGKGISDMIFYKACHGYHGLAIELKRSEKEKPTPEQQEWIDYFNEEGYFAYCAKGQDEAMAILDHYLN
ncbi:VRR-NUC domain-containing protein [bacterium]|nr:VRR-NUC domain-containing protein [bacterium]